MTKHSPETNDPKFKHRQIAERAYQIWEAAGRPVNATLQHWLQAEAELTGQDFASPAHAERIDPQSPL